MLPFTTLMFFRRERRLAAPRCYDVVLRHCYQRECHGYADDAAAADAAADDFIPFSHSPRCTFSPRQICLMARHARYAMLCAARGCC